MKLAAALINRADVQKRITYLQGRLLRTTFTQEGDKPFEQPEVLLAELGARSTSSSGWCAASTAPTAAPSLRMAAR